MNNDQNQILRVMGFGGHELLVQQPMVLQARQVQHTLMANLRKAQRSDQKMSEAMFKGRGPMRSQFVRPTNTVREGKAQMKQ